MDKSLFYINVLLGVLTIGSCKKKTDVLLGVITIGSCKQKLVRSFHKWGCFKGKKNTSELFVTAKKND